MPCEPVFKSLSYILICVILYIDWRLEPLSLNSEYISIDIIIFFFFLSLDHVLFLYANENKYIKFMGEKIEHGIVNFILVIRVQCV